MDEDTVTTAQKIEIALGLVIVGFIGIIILEKKYL